MNQKLPPSFIPEEPKKPDMSQYQTKEEAQEPDFLSRAKEVFKGLYGFGKDSFEAAPNPFNPFGNPVKAMEIGQGLFQPFKQYPEDIKTDKGFDPELKFISRFFGASPENIESDFSKGKYGAGVADLLPFGFAYGLHKLGSGKKTSPIKPRTELTPRAPKLEARPEELPGYIKPLESEAAVNPIAPNKAKFHNLPPSFQPDEVMPRYAKSGDEGVKIGADIASLGQILGSSLYSGDIGKIATKELLQNSMDAVRHLGDKGTIEVNISKPNKYIEVKDNGKGLTRTELESVFTDLGDSGKRSDTSAVGGFGLAKASYLLGGERAQITSVVDVQLNTGSTQRVKYTFEGTPQDLIKGVKINSQFVGKDVSTGTTVRTYIGEEKAGKQWDDRFYNAEDIAGQIANNSDFPGTVFINKNPDSPNRTSAVGIKSKLLGSTNTTKLSNPSADIEISIPKGQSLKERILQYEILNNGMWHGRTIYDYNPYPGIPEKVLVNIKSKVPEGHADYPFTANRETLRGTTDTMIKEYLRDTIINPAVGERAIQLKKAYSSIPKTSYGVDYYDVGKRFTDQELKQVLDHPVIQTIGTDIQQFTKQAVESLANLYDWKNRLDKSGLIFDEKINGLWMPNPGTKNAAVFVNPLQIMSKFSNPIQASMQIVHTLMHELAHFDAPHGENHTVIMGDIYGQLAEQIVKYEQQFAQRIGGKQYSPEIRQILSSYQESRGRTATFDDPLYGTGISAKNRKSGGKGNIPSDASSSGGNSESINKLREALRSAKPIREQQEGIYSKERGQRIAAAEKVKKRGEEGAFKYLSKMSGEHTKLTTEPLKLNQGDIDNLYNQIRDNREIDSFQKLGAIKGLSKLLKGEQVPQGSEIALLDKIFGIGSDIQQLYGGLGIILPEKINILNEAANVPRAIMASTDLSAPFRQGIGLVHQKAFWTSFDDMVKSFGSEKAFRGVMDSIEKDPELITIKTPNGNVNMKMFELAKLSKLSLTDLGNYSTREEAFMSKLVGNLPVIKGSNRAYVAFLDKLRYDSFKSLIRDADAAGHNPFHNIALTREIADYINNASGRGNLGGLEKIAVGLNNVLFSPRLIASRVRMLNPMTYVKATPFVRKQYIKSLIAITGMGSLVTGLGVLAGGQTETNPTSSDLGKLRIGNTRIDPFGGFQQYIVAFSRLLSGREKNSISGHEFTLGKKYGSPTRLDVAERFVESKLNPIMGMAASALRGKDFGGNSFNMPNPMVKDFQAFAKELIGIQGPNIPGPIADLFIPMVVNDLYEIWKDNPKLLPLAAPTGMLGMGLQTYSNKKR